MKKILFILILLFFPLISSASIYSEVLATTTKFRADLKGTKIAQLPFINTYLKGDIQVEIQSIQKIPNGIQIFARGWKNGVPLGFGSDGTTEIERFRFINPPILVEDSAGSINSDFIDIKGKLITRRLSENPIKAVTDVLAQVMREHGMTNTQIVKGKIGNTTSTYFGTADGRIYRLSGTDWATEHDATTGTADSANAIDYLGLTAPAGYQLQRSFTEFATTDLTGETISSATISVYGQNKDGTGLAFQVYSSTAGNPLINDDFNNGGTTAYADGITTANYSTVAYNTLTLNATGIAAINLSSNSKFSYREANYDAANVDPTNDGNFKDFAFYSTVQTGTSQDPYLTVVHTTPAPVVKTPPPLIITWQGYW